MHYSIMTDYDRSTEKREQIIVWSGPFASGWEARGSAANGASHYEMTDYSGKRFRAKLPEGVTAPRTEENFQQIDAAISAAYDAHNARQGRI